MGYRSEVKIIAGKNAAKELLAVNKKHQYFTVTPGKNDETLFEADYIKWYEYEDDIKEYADVIDKYLGLGSRKPEDGIDFIRTGEDLDDVDHNSTYSTHATLSTGIVVEGFTPKPTKKPTKKKATKK